MKHTLLNKSEGVFLDTASCGSSIRWTVTVERTKLSKAGSKVTHDTVRADTECSLTDCSRSVSWTEYAGVDTQLKKVRVAIGALRRYERELRKAQRIIKAHKPIDTELNND